FALFETFITYLQDDFKKLRAFKTQLRLGLGMLCFLAGLAFVTPAGIHLTTVFDTYGASYTLVSLCGVEVVSVMWGYGINTFLDDCEYMLGKKPTFLPFWYFSLGIWAPLVMNSMAVISLVKSETPKYFTGHEFSSTVMLMCWLLYCFIMAPVPLWFLLYTSAMYRRHGFTSLTEFLRILGKPDHRWGPADATHPAATRRLDSIWTDVCPASFLLVYIFLQLTIGLPLHFTELGMGQYSGKGPVAVWDFNPAARGIGVSMCAVSAIIASYYSVVLAYILFYLIQSLRSILPWTVCLKTWENCVEDPYYLSNVTMCVTHSLANSNCTCSGNEAVDQSLDFHCVPRKIPVAAAYFHNEVLQISYNMEPRDFKPSVKLFAFYGLVWLIVIACVVRPGMRGSVQLACFTAALPYIVFFILIGQGSFLEGATHGILHLFVPHWDKLADPQVWMSNSDVALVNALDLVTSTCSTVVLYLFIGHLASCSGVDVEDFIHAEPWLIFIAYPLALSMLALPQYWSVLTFVMMFTTCLDAQDGTVFTGRVVALCVDNTRQKDKSGCNLLTSPLPHRSLLAGTGIRRFLKDMEFMLGVSRRFQHYLFFALSLCCPCILSLAVVGYLIGCDMPTCKNGDHLPELARGMGWLLYCLVLLPVPLGFCLHVRSVCTRRGIKTWREDMEPEMTLRVKWSHKFEFLLSLIAFTTGLGNIWRFPFLCYKHGGASFMLVYLFLQMTVGFPLSFMELVLGIGISMCMTSYFIVIYYNALMSIIMFYMFSSLQESLPWSFCTPDSNCTCTEDPAIDNALSFKCIPQFRRPSEVYFYDNVVKRASSLLNVSDLGVPTWQLALCLLLNWIIVIACVIKGVRSSGKFVLVETCVGFLEDNIRVVRKNSMKTRIAVGVVSFLLGLPCLTPVMTVDEWFFGYLCDRSKYASGDDYTDGLIAVAWLTYTFLLLPIPIWACLYARAVYDDTVFVNRKE
ncbi:hypothetical protein BaRGS_00015014, partial [Batillaria attramentaria]